uniref:Probable G-protein coupled receptor 34 n=1 Tax=Tetraodon nigroviridis TaxID=99883 RepID=Q6XCB1_TETNG|nr:G-protein-coupled receptor GPR34 type 1 [Tetraodon nigroviridis]
MTSFFSTTGVPPPSTPAPTNQTPPCAMDDLNLRLPLAIMYSLFFISGLVGNLAALWVFLFLRSGRNSMRVFLINCAVADLVLLACLPFRIFYHANGNQWLMGSLACKVVGNLFYMNMYISIMLLALISLHRYLKLRGGGKAGQRMRVTLWGRRCPFSWVACGTLWCLSLVALVPMIVTAEDKENSNQCFHFRRRSSNGKGKAAFNALLVLFFWLVFATMVFCYVKIASLLLRVSRERPDLPNALRYQRSAKKSFFVLFLFIVCFGPYHAFRPFYIFYQMIHAENCTTLQMVDQTNEVVLLLSAFNSCLDPVMYFLLSGSVRRATLQTLGHQLGKRFLFVQEGISNSSTTEFRRSSLPTIVLNTTSVAQSTLRRTSPKKAPPVNEMK